MAPAQIPRRRINVRTNGVARNLVAIDENEQGDVYIRLKSGIQVGIPPNEIAIVQDRYSLHPSPKSEWYTTLKHTLELANGHIRTAVALTDAVKRKSGFAHLFSHRAADLVASINDVEPDDALVIDLGNFDPRRFALVLTIFVGHSNSLFPTDGSHGNVSVLQTREFQIVVCHAWFNVPATPFAWTMNSFTLAPESFENGPAQEAALQMMQGRPTEDCVSMFNSLANELLVNLLQTHQHFAPCQEAWRDFQACIDAVPRGGSITF